MALVDLKSKLNEFGKNNPDNPYQKGDRRGDLENSPTPDIDKDKYGLREMKYTIDNVESIYNRHKLINVRF